MMYPLSSVQEEIWLDQVLHPSIPIYNIGGYVRIEGPVDPALFKKAVERVIHENDSLRTILHPGEPLPVQEFPGEIQVEIPFHDFSQKPDPCQSANQWMEREFVKPFRLYDEILFRYALIRISDDCYYWFFCYHHLAADGWGILLIVQRVAAAYNNLSEESGAVEQEQKQYTYLDFVRDDREYLESGKFKEDERYWLDKYAWLPESLIPYRYAAKFKEQTIPSRVSCLGLDWTFYNRLAAFAKENKLTTFHVFLGALYCYFLRTTETPGAAEAGDFVIGLPILNRNIKAFKQTTGMFTGIIPARFHFGLDLSFTELMKSIRTELRKDYRHQRFPISEINRQCGIHKVGRNQLFDITLSYERLDFNTYFNGSPIETITLLNGFEQNALAIFIREFHEGRDVRVDFSYNLSAFEDDEIQHIIKRFRFLLEEILNHPGIPVRELQIIPPAERHRLLVEWNNTRAGYPRDKCIQQLFEEQVERTPDYIAVIGTGASVGTRFIASESNKRNIHLTYLQLNEKSHQLAYLLVKKGVRPDTIVGIMMDRCVEMIIGIIGILKAGGAYMPIDPEYPEERIDYMLKDSGTKILLTSPVLSEKFGKLLIDNRQLLMINEKSPNSRRLNNPPKEANSINNYQLTINNLQLKMNSLAYIIYTSGSTGGPKGVMIEHYSVINLVFALHRRIYSKYDEVLRVALMADYVFDASVKQIFASILGGHQLYIIDKESKTHHIFLNDFLLKHNIELMDGTPTLLSLLVNSPGSELPGHYLRHLIVGGETLPAALVNQFYKDKRNKNVIITNIYGPTESTVDASCYHCTGRVDFPVVPIGKPLSNIKLYILDQANQLLPIGTAGEIFISGPGLARGYLNNPELTAEKFLFVSNRFYRSYGSYMSYIIYKSGDQARWLPDGNIEFLGRRDLQVKIKGFRIELGEIEYRLLNHPDIKEAVVTADEDAAGNKFICAYIVPQSSTHLLTQFNSPELKEYLSRFLPNYMIPSYFVPLEELPLTPNGKINRKALSCISVDQSAVSDSYVPPGNETEEKLVEIWQEVLGREKVGIHDNFFEIGGDSIRAIQIASKAYESGIKLEMSHIFNTPTIRRLSKYVGKVERNKQPLETLDYGNTHLSEEDLENITRLYETDGNEIIDKIYPLSPMQEGFLYHRLMEEESSAYFQQFTFYIEGELDLETLEKSINRLIYRHDTLRTSFVYKGIQAPQQVVLKERSLKVSYTDLSNRNRQEQEQAIVEYKLGGKTKGFELTNDPLLRFALFETGKNSWVLIWSFHHIIMDGWCLGILIKELIEIYHALLKNEEIGLKPAIPYKKYIDWLANRDKEEGLKYWQRYLWGYNHQVYLPGGCQGKGNNMKEEYGFLLDKHITSLLYPLGTSIEVTLNTLVQTAWAVLLQRYNDTPDVVFGTVVSGRPPGIEGVESMVGLFINTIPVRIITSPGQTFASLVKEVQRQALQSKPWEYLPLTEIQGKTLLKADLINHIMVFENYPAVEEMKKIFTGAKSSLPFIIKHVDVFEQTGYQLDVVVVPTDELAVTISYNPGIYNRKIIENTAGHFTRIIQQVTKNKHIRVKDIDILTFNEKQQLLVEFNDTAADYPCDKTIADLFIQQVEKTPDNVALAGPQVKYRTHMTYMTYLSYRELNENSDGLAALLSEKGVLPDTIVGIMVERSIEMIIGVLGILKAGAAYLPIDPEYPGERINYMLADSGARLLLKKSEIRNSKSETNPNDLNSNDRNKRTAVTVLDFEHLNFQFVSNFDIRISDLNASNLAYIIYTSGSTGWPKGVTVEHKSVIDAVCWFIDNYRITSQTRVLQHTNYIFDPAVEQVFGTLFQGARLELVPKEIGVDIEKLYVYLETRQINIIDAAPLFLNELLGHKPKINSICHVISGGEPLTNPVKNRIIGKGYALYNHYGPTETTIEVLTGRCTKASLTLGKPTANTRCYILDSKNHLLPIGAAGEICISGAGLARGYLNNPELTDEKFCLRRPGALFEKTAPGPRKNFLSPHFLIYLTGDLGRWLLDGNIEFLGRRDHQIKIRGFRIELGEIRHRLSQHEDIKQAVVITNHVNKQKELIAFGIEERPGHFSHDRMRDYLSRFLPDYMIPSYFVSLDRFPRTFDGAIDQKALIKLALENRLRTASTNYISPRNQVEETLTHIWQEVLAKEKIGIRDNFFEIGGDSIKAIQITSRAHKHGIKLEIKHIFNNPTIGELSKYARKIEIKQPRDGPVTGIVEFTPIQEWFFQNTISYRHHFNQAMMLYRESGFKEDFIRKVFSELTRHHDALRMVYKTDGNKHRIIQENRGLEGKLFDFEVFHFENKDRDMIQKEIREQVNRIQAGIDLENGPLVKLALFKTGTGDHLLITVHHLVIDGVSWRILLEDFQTAYARQEKMETIRFQKKTTSFQYWAKKQKQYARSHILTRELNYWKDILQSSTHPLPKEKNIPPIERTYQDSETVTLEFTPQQTRELLEQSNRAFNTKINDLLLTALARSLKEWASMEKILINLEGHGREQIIEGIDINRTIGWFTSQFPVLLDISQYNDLSYQLQTIKETLRRIPDKGIGFGILRYLSPLGRELTALQEPEINFNYLGVFNQEKKQGVFEFSPLPTGNRVSPELKQAHPLEINGMVIHGKLTIHFTYNKHEYTGPAITKLAAGYKSALLEIINLCVNKKQQQLTPGDYGDSRLSLEDLEKIIREVRRGRHGPIRWIYPLSPMQEGILYHWLLDKSADAYIAQNTFQLRGEIDCHKLEEIINRLIRKHEILRTLFIYKGIETPKQVVVEDRPIKVNYLDISTMSPQQQEKQIAHYKQGDRSRGFDLCNDLLQRFALYRLNPSTCVFIWSTHHILLDGWSMGILLKELVSYFTLNNRSFHGASGLPYRNYIRWLEKQDREESINYWKCYLEGYERQVYLPDRQQAPGKPRHESFVFVLDESTTTLLKRTASTHRVTLNTAIQIAWGILLQQYNDTDDAVFGIVVSGRPAGIDGIESAIGLFINTIPVRIKTWPNQTFTQLATEVQAAAIRAKYREHLPLVEIQNLSTLKSELINHIIVFENYPIDRQLKKIFAAKTREFSFSIKHIDIFERTNYELEVLIKPGKELTLCCNYNAKVYKTAIIKKTARHFARIIEQITKNQDSRIKDIDILTFIEKQQLLVEFNNTAADYPRDKTIADLFSQQVEKTPDNVALAEPQVKYRTHMTCMTYLSYRELNEKSNQLALLLQAKGVQPDTIVGIMTERSIEMVIGIFGILKAGGAYLPIDPDYPEERINYMLNDSGARLLIKKSEIRNPKSETNPNDLNSNDQNKRTAVNVLDFEHLNFGFVSNFDIRISDFNASNLAYIIYTSGSTAKPKGVILNHSPLVNLIEWMNRLCPITGTDVVLLQNPYTFDMSIWGLFAWSFYGASTYLLPPGDEKDPKQIIRTITRQRVTLLHFVPSMLTLFLDYLEAGPRGSELSMLRAVFSSGETLSKELVQRGNKRLKLYNLYGPTETHVVSYFDCSAYKNLVTIPIGKPISNTVLYILNRYSKQLVPIGIVGELYIGGDCLSRGYMNRPELTCEKFKIPPFPHSPIYRTGDLALWLQDGNIEFLGRSDDQVKIRGFRIQLEEIIHCLTNHPGIREAVVIAKHILNQTELVAYVVDSPGEGPETPAGYRDHLNQFLPGYMIPSYFVRVEHIPLTPNGKIDKKALSRIAVGKEQLTTSNRYVPPGDEIEKELVRVWQEVLGIEKIGINDNFIDLGGHSLKAVQVISRIYKKMGIDIGVNRFFQNPTIKKQALEIKNLQWFSKDEDQNEPGTGESGEIEIIL